MRSLMVSLTALFLVSTSSAAWAFPFFFHPPIPHHNPAPTSVPELDGSMAGVALALIAGGAAIAHGRKRARS